MDPFGMPIWGAEALCHHATALVLMQRYGNVGIAQHDGNKSGRDEVNGETHWFVAFMVVPLVRGGLPAPLSRSRK